MHIFGAKSQSATKYKLDNGLLIKFNKRKLIFCWDCRKQRWAVNLKVCSYYDGDYFFCKDGKGCKK